MNIRKLVMIVVAVLAAGFLLIQLVPYGRAHENPAVVAEPNWDSPHTRELAQRACFDCHSNETIWPWYSNVAPFSWLVQRDVDEGRNYLNFSEWGQGGEGEEAEEMGEAVQEGEMPPSQYLITHGDARLSQADRAALIAGLEATSGLSPRAGGSAEGNEHEEDDDD